MGCQREADVHSAARKAVQKRSDPLGSAVKNSREAGAGWYVLGVSRQRGEDPLGPRCQPSVIIIAAVAEEDAHKKGAIT